MNLKIISFINKINPILWQIICLTISLTLFTLILLNRSPNLIRPISISLRTGFGLVVPAATYLVYLSLRIPGRIGYLAGMAMTMMLFALALAGLWASGQTQSTILSGIIPLYDAQAYYIDALRLNNGMDFSIFSARRPLFAGLLATFLSWTNHDLMAVLAILTGISGLACYFASREVQRTHGAEAATFILIVLFLFFRAHSGISMSENLGVALGALGFALLWQGANNRKILYLWAGLFTTTLALNARAGAFFMLPLLIFWAAWLLRDNKEIPWKQLLIASTAVALGFILNLVLTRLIAVPSGVPFANFSYTLYGLASGGKSWTYIFEAHPEVLAIQEPEQTRQIYRLALELIRTHPIQMIQGAIFNWTMLFSNSWYNIYAYVGGGNRIVNLCIQWVMYLLGLTGIYAWFKDRNDSIKSLIIVAFFGVFISVPFLPPTDAYRMRPYAASIIILAALPALGLTILLKRLNFKLFSTQSEIADSFYSPLVSSLLLILVILTGPVIVRYTSTPPSLQARSCEEPNSEFILTQFDKNTYINIKRESLLFLDWMPNYHIGQFRRNAHGLTNFNLINWAASIEPSTTLFQTLDFHRNQQVLVAFKTTDLPIPGEYYQYCGVFETDPSLSSYRIFYSREAIPLSQ